MIRFGKQFNFKKEVGLPQLRAISCLFRFDHQITSPQFQHKIKMMTSNKHHHHHYLNIESVVNGINISYKHKNNHRILLVQINALNRI